MCRMHLEVAQFEGTIMSRKQTPQKPVTAHAEAVPKKNALMDIPEAAVEMCTTVFAIRRLCRSGMLRYSQPGHPFLISPDAIQDCIRLMEQNAKAKRGAKLARKKKAETGNAAAKPAHRSPCGLPGCLICAAFERGQQRARELRLISNS
jgi:hypothetical protein